MTCFAYSGLHHGFLIHNRNRCHNLPSCHCTCCSRRLQFMRRSLSYPYRRRSVHQTRRYACALMLHLCQRAIIWPFRVRRLITCKHKEKCECHEKRYFRQDVGMLRYLSPEHLQALPLPPMGCRGVVIDTRAWKRMWAAVMRLVSESVIITTTIAEGCELNMAGQAREVGRRRQVGSLCHTWADDCRTIIGQL